MKSMLVIQVFQMKTTQIKAQLTKTQAKRMEFTVIREALDEMKQWEIDNPNALEELP
jgi:hypothetical protein